MGEAVCEEEDDNHDNIQCINILADYAEPCSATVPSQHWAAEKQT